MAAVEQDHPKDVFQAYHMNDSDEDQGLPPFPFSNEFLVQLAEHGSLSCTLNPDSYRRDEELKKIQGQCDYSNMFTNVCPETLPNGEVKGTDLSEKHIHTDELIRHRINCSRICSCLPAVHVGKSAFHMDDRALHGTCEPYAKDLLLGAMKEFEIFNEDIITEAFYQAVKAHRGQMRANGDPYIQHCLETAKLLASLGANSIVVAAGILHDTLDDSFMCYDCIFGKFGAEIADLIEWVSVISDVSKLARVNNTASKRDEAVGLHTMVLSGADIRAVIIKLADQLHNMMTLNALPLDKQKRVAKETMEIFVPLANRLGISNWKVQLETLCFKHLNPGEYNELHSKLVHSFDEAMVTSATKRLERALKDEAIFYHDVYGRHKSLYSIHCKMSKKNLKIDQIHDIHGIRAIVEDEKDCYGAIRVVHQLWPEVPGKFKDYIAQPQSNGYQSLHTVVLVQGKVKLEVQIRTREMHLHAEFGFAAHWRYKEGDYIPPLSVLQIVEWARWVVACHCGARSKDKLRIGSADSIKPPCMFRSHSDDCPHSYKPQDCGQDEPVFVMIIENDKMSVRKFCADYTIMHLLVERARQGICWWEEPMPRLNNEPVSDPTCKLQMGDVVELTPPIPEKSLTEYRDEIHRIYEREMRLLEYCDAGQIPFAFLEHSD